MKKITDRDPNAKNKRQLSIGHQSNNYRKLMRLANDKTLPDKPVDDLKMELEMVMNIGGVDDPSQDFQLEYNELKITVINRLQGLIDSKSRPNLPIILPNGNHFGDDLIDRAQVVGRLLNINSTRIIQTVEHDIGLTMDFIKLADNFIENNTNIVARTDLVKFLGSVGISQSSNDSVRSNFVNTMVFLLVDYVTYELGVVEEESFKEAQALLEDAFSIPGFEDEVRDAYFKLQGEELMNHLIKILVHFDVVNDSIHTYIKNE